MIKSIIFTQYLFSPEEVFSKKRFFDVISRLKQKRTFSDGRVFEISDILKFSSDRIGSYKFSFYLQGTKETRDGLQMLPEKTSVILIEENGIWAELFEGGKICGVDFMVSYVKTKNPPQIELSLYRYNYSKSDFFPFQKM